MARVYREPARGRETARVGSPKRKNTVRVFVFSSLLAAGWTTAGGCTQRPSAPPGAQAIAEAFVRGINAWVAVARERLPEEFILAGWKPEFWAPDDLLSRTDAFLASGNALMEVFAAQLIAAAGERRARDILRTPLAI